MARPRSEDKRNALLLAATKVVAEQGTGAPTARIAKAAGVAEGTLFTYFENKDALFNQLYLHLKTQMRTAMMADYPRAGAPEQRARHAWSAYVDWGVADPDGHRALRHLGVASCIAAENRAAGAEGFGDLGALLRETMAVTGLSKDKAQAFVGALFTSMAETTMEFIVQHPRQAKAYREAGFNALWGALHAARPELKICPTNE